MAEINKNLSVVIPVFNSQDTLPLLIEEICNVMDQGGWEYEIILVNDGSQDNSWQVIQNLIADPGHLFYMLMPTLDVRTRFLGWMKSQEILCVFHYLPLHLSEMGLQLGGRPGDCPVTEDISDRLVRLPLFYDITDDEVAEVLNSVKSFEL